MEEVPFVEEAHFPFPLSAFVVPPGPEDDDDDEEERRETLDAVILAALVYP
jgi:hypothetical protein